MKKFYSLVLAWVACATTAFAASITLNIDDATRVKVLVDYTDYAVVTGANTITSDSEYGYVTIQTTSSDYGLTSVTVKNATGAAQSPEYIYSDKCSFSLGSYTDGWTYTVTSFSYAELRTASCKVYVDDASKVSLTRYNGSPITLEDGVNTVAFIPSTESKAESPFGLRGESTLYAVKINGVEQTASWGSSYDLDVANGDSVTILANFPDVDVPVQFVAGDAKSAGFITAVEVDDAPVTNWADDDFTVKLGSTVTFDYNTADYSKDSIFVDGEKISNYGSYYSFVVTTTTTHTVKYYAHKYATYNITINIDDPSHITLYKGYSYYNQEITGLVSGENTVSLAETITGISFKAASGCWVKSFTDALDNDYTETSSYSLVPTTENDTFYITTGAANRYATAVFYIDSVSKATHGGGITFPDRTSPLVFQKDYYGSPVAEDGYNTFAFDPEYDSTLLVTFYGAEQVYLYVNDSLVQPDYEGGTNFTLSLDDEDVVKAFLAAAPDTFSVTFKETEEYKFIDITEDIVSRLAALPTNPFEGEALTGTLVTFSVTEGGVVYKNDEKIEPDKDGIYSATVTADVVFEIKATETAIENTKTVLNRNVYTVEGILLLQDATDAQIKALPAGLYIINGASTYLYQH